MTHSGFLGGITAIRRVARKILWVVVYHTIATLAWSIAVILSLVLMDFLNVAIFRAMKFENVQPYYIFLIMVPMTAAYFGAAAVRPTWVNRILTRFHLVYATLFLASRVLLVHGSAQTLFFLHYAIYDFQRLTLAGYLLELGIVIISFAIVFTLNLASFEIRRRARTALIPINPPHERETST